MELLGRSNLRTAGTESEHTDTWRMTGELGNQNEGIRADFQIFGSGYGKGTG